MKEGVRRTEGIKERKRIKEKCAESDVKCRNVKFQESVNPDHERRLVEGRETGAKGCASTRTLKKESTMRRDY